MELKGGPKRMETFVSSAAENGSRNLHSITNICTLLHENLFGMHLNNLSIASLQSGDSEKYIYFLTVHSFVNSCVALILSSMQTLDTHCVWGEGEGTRCLVVAG